MSGPPLRIQFFAVLREQAGRSTLDLLTNARTPAEVYAELQARHGLQFPPALLRVAINGRYAAFDAAIEPGDHVVFIPPVAGG
jgi:molybdopterin converting factor subunit 1